LASKAKILSPLKKAFSKLGIKLAEGFRRLSESLRCDSKDSKSKQQNVPKAKQESKKDGKTFGVNLEKIMGEEGEEGLPLFIQDAYDFLVSQKSSKQVIKAFNRPVNMKRVQKIVAVYESDNPTESARKIVLKGRLGDVGAAFIHFLDSLKIPLCYTYPFFQPAEIYLFSRTSG
jgi:hypothetical protein